MANYDDIFNASAQEGTEDKSFVSFNKEEWAAQKKQERESAFAMIDETAQRMANDGGLFQSYLDVQARFDRYSVGNAVLITAQKADATQLSDFKGWKNNGVFIKKGESLFCFRHSLFPSSVKRALSAVSVIICGSVVIIVIAGQIIHTVLHSVDDILSSLTDTVYHVVHNIAVSVVISCAVVIHRTVIV